MMIIIRLKADSTVIRLKADSTVIRLRRTLPC
jgi:hypothetical protein